MNLITKFNLNYISYDLQPPELHQFKAGMHHKGALVWGFL